MCTLEANYRTPVNCKYSLALTEAAKNQRQTNTGGLAKLMKLKFTENIRLDILNLLKVVFVKYV